MELFKKYSYYKPDIFVHGDDWKKSDAGIKLRNNTIAAIKKIKGK